MENTFNFWSFLTLLLYLFNWGMAIYFVLDLVFKRHDPVKTLSWSIVLLAFPYIGLLIYFYFGRSFRKTKLYSRKGMHEGKLKKEFSAHQIALLETNEHFLPEDLETNKKLVMLCLNNNKSLLTEFNKTFLYFTGREALDAMLEQAQQARHHIHLQSFIIENDAVGTRWKNLLVQKAREGVEVRVIYDDFGSWHLPKEFLRDLRQAGAQIEPFGKVGIPGLHARINYRNHRKILVVDGTVAFIGGVNIADRYYDGGTNVQWRDTQIRIEGQAVSHIQSSFLMDWFFITHKNLRARKRYDYALPPLSDDVQAPESCFMQIVSSGPDSEWADIMQLYLTLITQAQKYIHLISPYFIPNETILNAIRTAALGGVEVNVLIPEFGDSAFVHAATLSFVSELLDAGVKVYMYTKGFIHAKVISIDGTCCLIGSANMDMRSLEHHFEIGAIIYNTSVTRQIDLQFAADLHESRLITSRSWAKRGTIARVKESLARLLSPLL